MYGISWRLLELERVNAAFWFMTEREIESYELVSIGCKRFM